MRWLAAHVVAFTLDGTKSESFVYWRGRPSDTSTQPGSSSFNPRPDSTYCVTFRVIQPDPAASGYAVLARAYAGSARR